MRETWKEKKARRERRVGALNLKGERRKDLARKSKAVERIDCQMRKEMNRCLMMIPAEATPFLSLKREAWTAAEMDMAVSVRTKPPPSRRFLCGFWSLFRVMDWAFCGRESNQKYNWRNKMYSKKIYFFPLK